MCINQDVMFFNFVIIFKFVIFRDSFIEFFPTESNPVKNTDIITFIMIRDVSPFGENLKFFHSNFWSFEKTAYPELPPNPPKLFMSGKPKKLCIIWLCGFICWVWARWRLLLLFWPLAGLRNDCWPANILFSTQNQARNI